MKIQLLQKSIFTLLLIVLVANPLQPIGIFPPVRTYPEKKPGLKILTWNIYIVPISITTAKGRGSLPGNWNPLNMILFCLKRLLTTVREIFLKNN
jgi:hypothetical protein